MTIVSNDKLVTRFSLKSHTCFVNILVKSRLILKVWTSGREPTGFSVDIE